MVLVLVFGFVEIVASLYYKKYELQKMKFISKHNDEKIIEIWENINKLKSLEISNLNTLQKGNTLIIKAHMITFAAYVFIQTVFFFLYKF